MTGTTPSPRVRRLLYVVGFPLDEQAGRVVGTLNKHRELRALLERADLWDISNTIGGRMFAHTAMLKGVAKVLAILELNLRLLVRGVFSRSWDTVIARDLPLFAAPLLRWRGVRFILEVHADFSEEIRMIGGRLQRAVTPVYAWMLDRQMVRADAVIFNHPRLEAALRQRLGLRRPTLATYNGADVDTFRPLDRRACRAELGLPLDPPLVMFVGHVKVWHGVESLLATFGRLQALVPDARLYIVGSGTGLYARNLRARYEGLPGITFIPPVTREVSGQYICAADLCALPVKDVRASPGSPIKLYDYAACAAPIVAQAGYPGYDDVVREHELGIAVDFERPDEAARAMAQYLHDLRDLEAETRARIRRAAEGPLSWRAVVETWIRFLESLPRRPER